MERAEAQHRKKQVHSEAFRQAVIQACCEPGASVAGVALANGFSQCDSDSGQEMDGPAGHQLGTRPGAKTKEVLA